MPTGVGGPWQNTSVSAEQPSDVYLMTGYDHKLLRLSHQASSALMLRLEVDISGNGDWCLYQRFDVPAGAGLEHRFPQPFHAYWARLVSSQDAVVSAQFQYT